MKLTFLGATGTVTGSKYLLESANTRLLVDCGLFQGYKELRLRNWDKFPVNPASIDAVLLTHAHIDHSGYIPLLVKKGFRGKIYCSEATYALCEILLPDSGYLQEEDARRANQYGYSKHTPAFPLYTEEEARDTLAYFHPVDFGTPCYIDDVLRFTLSHSGHILGSSFIVLSNGHKTVTFSGDLGRPNNPVMRAPAELQDTDYLLIESTYGDRLHERVDPTDEIAEVINSTVSRGGKVIIPAFAVGRAQMILYYLHQLKMEKRIPDIPVYLDSPMAISATNLLKSFKHEHQLSEALCADVCKVAQYIHTVEESKAIDASPMPSVIISASGMATGGRVLHHLKHTMTHERNTILFTGFQAGGTRGDRMLKGEPEIKIHGDYYPLKARVENLDSVSAHADYEEILEWLSHFKRPPVKVFVTHGEPEAAASLKTKIEERFGWDVEVPEYLEKVIL
jgi:metallo-beta-lactamase family protein